MSRSTDRLIRVGWLGVASFLVACLGGPQQSAGPPSTTTPTAASASPTTSVIAADEVFRRVSPSLAFVATEVGRGSALLVDGRHVVTNAHVVRPYAEARLVLADGTAIEKAPVVGWDLQADLALLDAGLRPARPVLRSSDARTRTGERVYLVGYPLADASAPSATITEGIISGSAFEWIDGLTFHQTDAVIEDGQSGGVLVDAQGRLLGITGSSRGRFAMALDAADALDRVERLLAGEDVDRTGDHLLPAPDPAGEKTVTSTLRHRADARLWVIDGARGDEPATISVTSDRPVALFGLAAAGRLGNGAGPPGVDLRLSMPFDAIGPYAVKIESTAGRDSKVTVRSSVGLSPVEDVDDGRAITADEPVVGAADYAGDVDWYTLAMTKGESITVRASAAAMDPALFIDRVGDDPGPLAFGHNEGGPLGNDDVVQFRAPADGEYLVVVTDPRFMGAGAYGLDVQRD
jgi:hypothetical protein